MIALIIDPHKELGKNIGDDFKEGKITFPISVALEHATGEERKFWKRVFEDLEQHSTDFNHALSLLHRHRALEETEKQARIYATQARDALRDFAPLRQKRSS